MVKWAEEWYDTLMYVAVLMVALIFYMFYWQEEYRIRYADLIVNDFLNRVAAEGSFSVEEYEALMTQLEKISTGYQIEFECYEREEEPCYALVPKEQLRQYYEVRNVRKKITLDTFVPETEMGEQEKLKLQEETNASILASADNYLPLPEKGTDVKVVAVREKQSVYEGEALITLCMIISEKGSYYAEAAPVVARQSGIVQLFVEIGGDIVSTEIEVTCYPRIKVCNNGHEYLNTKERIVASEQEGEELLCPVCNNLPKKITCSKTLIYQKLGQKLSEEDIWLTVTYLDGHEEVVTPASGEWKDNFDEEFCGFQSVVIEYLGIQTQVSVITESERCKACGRLCEGRNYADYMSFPYCVDCMAKVPLYTGEVYEVEVKTGYAEIISVLDQRKEFCMERGTFLVAYLKNEDTCLLMKQVCVKKRGGGNGA